MPRLPPLSAWSAALVAALVGFGGTVALVVRAQGAVGASVAQVSSAVSASCLGIAVTGAALSWWLRLPVVLAWSTPGAALLAVATPGTRWPVAVGAFIAAALGMVVVGVIPALGRLVQRIPAAVASAMLAGVLLPFCLELFRIGGSDPLLLAVVLGVFLLARPRLPRYALLLVLAAGTALTVGRGAISTLPPGATFTALEPTPPSVSFAALLGLALPLFLVTLVSQNLPGLVVLRAAGYEPPSRPLLVGTGLASLVMAPFGSHALNLAAITAAICTSDEAHPERARRWTVGVLYAAFYLVLAVLAPTLVRFFLALPPSVIGALTGVALLPALLSSLESALAVKDDREPALVTFLAAGSGVTLFGLGSAFWGLVVGVTAVGLRSLARSAPPATRRP